MLPEINRVKLDLYLNELAKTIKLLDRKSSSFEMILVGGASIVINYEFRVTTYDVDAIVSYSSIIKEASNIVGDKYDLPRGWISSDFVTTKSYSDKLRQYSKFYKTFCGILEVRTVDAEYLIAMKLMAGRLYKNDLSDILGILISHQELKKPIDFDLVNSAFVNLYNNLDLMPLPSREFISALSNNIDLDELYNQIKSDEQSIRKELIEVIEEQSIPIRENNLQEIINIIKKKV